MQPNTQRAYEPTFRIVANDNDITETIRKHFISLTLTDEAGMQSDVLTITLNDSAHLKLPPTGAELKLWLGYAPQVKYMGLYVVDGLTLSGPPEKMKITARGVPFEKSRSYSELQTRRTRSWRPRTVGELVGALAAEHGLNPAVAEDVAGMALRHMDQVDESDLNLLTRIAGDLGLVAKVGGGSMVFMKRGEGKTVSGKELPVVTLTPEDVISWSVNISDRADYGRVVAVWRDVDGGKDVEESVGDGEPVFRIRHLFPTKEAARAAARAKLEGFRLGKRTLALTMQGNSDLCAEGRVALVRFRDHVAGTWDVSRVEYRLDGGGYGINLNCEDSQL